MLQPDSSTTIISAHLELEPTHLMHAQNFFLLWAKKLKREGMLNNLVGRAPPVLHSHPPPQATAGSGPPMAFCVCTVRSCGNITGGWIRVVVKLDT